MELLNDQDFAKLTGKLNKGRLDNVEYGNIINKNYFNIFFLVECILENYLDIF